MDSAAFCVANAVYDPLFRASADGSTWLPNLALSAVPNAAKNEWTITLRQGVHYYNSSAPNGDGGEFTADDVVGNYAGSVANFTVGLAIKPLIKSCVKVSKYQVKYTTMMPWTTFPFQLSEQQISYMAHSSVLDTAGGKPVGTGPFYMNSLDDWDHNVQGGGKSTWLANPNYWKKDANGGSLPYVDSIIFKVIVQPAARWTALQTGTIDLMVMADGGTIKTIKTAVGGRLTTLNAKGKTTAVDQGSNSDYQWVSDENGGREPAVNCIILNTQMTSKSPKGAVNPSTNLWDAARASVITDPTIRQACAMAINRSTYWTNQDGGIGQVTDGIYRPTINGNVPTGGLYKDPKYPKYSVTNGKKLVDAWKKKHPTVAPAFVIDIVEGNTPQTDAFTFIKNALAAIGITVTSREMPQSALINAKIFKTYDASTWSQFGGMTPDLNYVWFNAGNFVNFAQQNDPKIQAAMLNGMKATTVAARNAAWQDVNTRMAIDVPYLFLDTTVNMFAARANVRNFAYATSASGTGPTPNRGFGRAYSPDGGSAAWEHIYFA